MNSYSRILLLKMDHIGDALWSFPAIRALRTAFPKARIDMLCTPYLAEAFRRLPDLTEVIEYDPKSPLTARIHTLKKLRQHHYEVSLVLGPVDKVSHLAFFSGATEQYSYAYEGNILRSLANRIFLTHRYPHPADVANKSGLALPHEVPSMIALVERIGAIADPEPSLFFPLSAEEIANAAATLKNQCQEKNAYAAIHLCAKSFAYGWNEAAFLRLAATLQSTFPEIGWVVTAGPAEQPYLASYRLALSSLNIPIISGMQLAATAALLANLELLISWDTGVVHLAAAVGTPIIDLFPDKNYEYCLQRWGPWSNQAIPLTQKQPPSMSDDFTEIVSAAKKLLDGSVSSQ